VYIIEIIVSYKMEKKIQIRNSVKTTIMVSANSIPDAMHLLYATYYVLWLEYRKAAVCCYKYLELEIFEQKAGKLPPKLIRLLSSCRK